MKICVDCGQCYDDSIVECSEEGHSFLSETRDGDRTRIEGYRLEALLSSGGKAEAYRARRIECGSPCLIKIVLAEKGIAERFLQEAGRAAALFHPNLVDIYEAGSLETGEIYVVTEEPDARDLRGFLDSVGVPDLMTAIEIVRQTAAALHALHRENIIHGAVRPESITLNTGADGKLIVRLRDIDFAGINQRTIVSNKFAIDSAVDSLRYFAPELCTGGDACPQTDVYGLGIVFYEMLAGRPPFDAAKASALIEKQKNERPPDVRIDNFELRMLVTHALMESLQKQPNFRQSSADLFARQMRHIELEATHVSTPPPAGTVPVTPVRQVQPVRAITSVPISSPPQPAKPHVTPPVVMSSSAPAKPDEIEIEIPISSGETQTVLEAPAPETIETHARAEDRVTIRERAASLHGRVSRLKQRMKAWRPRPILATSQTTTPAPGQNAIIRTKIEWQQPEDDIPSVADVLAVIAGENESTPAIAALPETSVVERAAKIIELTDSRDEIAAVEATVEDPVPPSPAVDDVITLTTPVQTADVIELIADLAEDEPAPKRETRPAVERVPAAIKRDPPVIKAKESYRRLGWVKDVLKEDAGPRPVRIPVVRDELEEITLVRPRRSTAIRIDLDRPVPRFRNDAIDEIKFVPTLLDDSEKRREIAPELADSIFSTISSQSPVSSSMRRRVAAVGGVSALLIVGFLFGDDLGRYVQTGSADDSVAAQAGPAETTTKRTASTGGVTTSKKKAAKVKPKPEIEKEAKREPSKARVSNADKKSAATTTVKTAARTAKTKPAADARKRPPERKPVANRSTLGTRPRIVANPR